MPPDATGRAEVRDKLAMVIAPEKTRLIVPVGLRIISAFAAECSVKSFVDPVTARIRRPFVVLPNIRPAASSPCPLTAKPAADVIRPEAPEAVIACVVVIGPEK